MVGRCLRVQNHLDPLHRLPFDKARDGYAPVFEQIRKAERARAADQIIQLLLFHSAEPGGQPCVGHDVRKVFGS